MDEEKRETVVVDNGRSSNPLGWIIVIVVLVVLIALFLMNGGFGLFGGGTTNVEAPETINVQPSTGQ